MLTLNFNPFPALTTERLILRMIVPEDVNEIFFLRSDKSVLKYKDKKPAQSLEEASQWIQMITDKRNNNELINWGICLKDNNRLLGSIGFWNILNEHGRAETGYVLHPEFHGKGIMHEAMVAVLKYGFEIMKLHSIEAHVNPLNEASIKLLEKNHFVREGYFRENFYCNGNFLDTSVYSLVAPTSTHD